MLKRFTCVFTAFILTLSLSMPAIGDTDVSYTIVEDDMLSNTAVALSDSLKVVTVSEIQSLMNERSLALVAGDYECYSDITDKLREYGVLEISYEKLTELLGEGELTSLSNSADSTVTTSNSIFEYYYTTYTYSGVTYDIMRILASPNYNTQGDTVLYSSGVKTLQNTKSSTLIATKLLNTTITSLIGLSSGGTVALTLYDVFDAVSSGLNSSSTVSNVKANYTWSLAEDCSWIYVSKKDASNYQIAGRFSKASMGINIAIPTLVVDGMNSTAYVQSVNKQIQATPKNYDSTYQAVSSLISGNGVYESMVTSMPITGIEGQTVATARLSNPAYPLYAE